MADMLVFGVLTASGLYVILLKSGQMRRLIRYEVLIDVVFTAALVIIFGSQTYSGIMTGIIAGLTLSGLLTLTKQIYRIFN